MFHIGQKVICVDNAPRNQPCKLKKDAVYTIRGFCRSPAGERGGVYVEEIVNVQWTDGRERGFYGDRFRPVAERKTDISVFTKMLGPKTRRRLASAG